MQQTHTYVAQKNQMSLRSRATMPTMIIGLARKCVERCQGPSLQPWVFPLVQQGLPNFFQDPSKRHMSLSMLCHGYINLRFFRSPTSTPTSLHFPLDFPPLLPLPLPGRRARGALNKNTLAPLSKQNRWINDGGQQ